MRADKRGLFGEMVGCNTELMYTNIMKNFRWGGLDKPGVNIYMDENNLRFTTNQRLQMMSLAKLLNDEGKSKEAIEVLDRCLQVMPTSLVPLEPAMVYAVEGYYKAGAIEKANKLSSELFAVCEQEYQFFSKVAGTHKEWRASYEGDLGRLSSALDMLNNYAETYGQKEMATQYTARMTAIGLTPRPAQPQFPQQQQPQPMNMDQINMDSLMEAMKKMDSMTGANPK
jgi:tetratricopeptide (TPR) repeat protein